MKIAVHSDIHLEFGDMPVPTDDAEVLVLAGDIGMAGKPATYINFLKQANDKYEHVIYIPGNHEYYRSSLQRAIPKIQKAISDNELNNVSFGNRFVVKIDDTVFVNATLWTNMNNEDPLTMVGIKQYLNDFNLIRTGSTKEPYKRTINPIDLVAAFKLDKEFIFEHIKYFKESGYKVVAVTHHGPSELSIADQYKDQTMTNGAYVSSLENEILDSKPDLWIHGHTHCSFDYNIGDTRVVVNPRGYFGYDKSDLNPEYIANLVIEI